jgi:hypothetical protein
VANSERQHELRKARVTLDGDKPGDSGGADLEADGTGRFDIPRMTS